MSDMNDWRKQLAQLRGSTAPPKEKQQDASQGKGKGKKSSQNKPPGGKKGSPSRRGGGGGRGDDRYFLPADTLSVLEPQLGLKRQKIDNFALLLNKCALFDSRQNKFVLSRQEERRRGVEGYRLAPNFHPAGVKEIAARHEQAINALGLAGTEKFSLTIDWRLIVGLGTESVYETSMTLHHIYGIPYIPGQAVKGVLRSWIILECFAESQTGELDLKHAEEQALKKQWFCDIFGCPKESVYKEARQGIVYFFDAFPTHLNKESIQPDIMNPHYGPYYAEGKPPADYHNPIPVNFLTVQNTTFEFYVGAKHSKNTVISEGEFKDQTPLAIVKNMLPEALSKHGLGAKTAVGYGYFSS